MLPFPLTIISLVLLTYGVRDNVLPHSIRKEECPVFSNGEYNAMGRAGLLEYDDDGRLQLNASVRSELDEHEYDAVELETKAERFLEEVIMPRMELFRRGELLDENGNPATSVWTDDLIRQYVAARNSARMFRPCVMERIEKRNK
jgi:hypothetical protein